jgi:hypothetical protein
VSAKFIEFLGASGGMVYINADTIDAISVGSPTGFYQGPEVGAPALCGK